MELTLERSDLFQVGTCSHLGTLALTADKKSGRLRIVVGDDRGEVHAYEVKRGQPALVFKASAGKGAVQAMCKGGGAVKDRVFCAVGQVVVGLGRKGKQFFSLQSSLVEPIRFLSVDEALLFTGGDYAHSRYKDGADDGFYTCPDKITCMCVQKSPWDSKHHVFLGCKDRRIHIVEKDHVIGEIAVDRAATALAIREVEAAAYELVVGDEGGTILCYRISDGLQAEAWRVVGTARVTCVSCFDVTCARGVLLQLAVVAATPSTRRGVVTGSCDAIAAVW